MHKLLRVEQLGVMGYEDALQLQRRRVAQRKTGEIPDTLLLLEHPHVYTLGRNATRNHLLVSAEYLHQLGAEVYETDRGGDITYHGPGQLVGYPIIDLAQHRRDISWYMRSLEEVLIGVAAEFGVCAGRISGAAGVWVGEQKLVAMGVHVSRWVTSHGFAFNVSTNLKYFDYIVPCGLADKGVTSLEKLAGHAVPMNIVLDHVIRHFSSVFGFTMDSPAKSRVDSVLART